MNSHQRRSRKAPVHIQVSEAKLPSSPQTRSPALSSTDACRRKAAACPERPLTPSSCWRGVSAEAWSSTRSPSGITGRMKSPSASSTHFGESNGFDEVRSELNKLEQNSQLNKWYVSISKLPPLGRDPRQQLANRPPSCFEDLSVPRAQKVMARWNSMPHLPEQLPVRSLRDIEARVRWLRSSASIGSPRDGESSGTPMHLQVHSSSRVCEGMDDGGATKTGMSMPEARSGSHHVPDSHESGQLAPGHM
eukprot:gnl/TRDRNA2_/TRDRNA2_41868_c0_seq1.p1 gnl/TRDRNA2_/TRDRNA2_41868_c0~~gnl/TRDRNA2_/TRDRNA2_41868_c0_seq1.p1  ORF type:complete len:249 (-),score=28.74 gnl/TRDRNA2_/TRDRNA2_41868_c0_seq1:99-845(-)